MTFSFDASLSTKKDKVRWLIGDTEDVGHEVENETIAAVLVDTGDNAGLAAAQIARAIASRFARKVSKSVGRTRIELSDLFKHWSAVADKLEASGGAMDGTGIATADPMSVGGISEAKRDDLRTGDTDRIQPSFSIGQDDNPIPHTPTPPYDPTL